MSGNPCIEAKWQTINPGEQWSTTLPLEESAVAHCSCPEFTLQTFHISESVDASSITVFLIYILQAVNKNTNSESYFSVVYLTGFSKWE